MKKILGIVASARRLGNCEIMVKEIGRHVADEGELLLLRLTDLDIAPCRGCYRCLLTEGDCHINDDFDFVLSTIAAADALVLAAPTYFLSAHSALKRFLDRGLAFYGSVDRLWGKPAVGVAIAGIQGMEGSALLGIEQFLKLILADVRQTRVMYGALPGEVFLNGENRHAASVLAASLFGDSVPKSAPVCPLCGGDTFRFTGPQTVRCMLCSNAGKLRMQNGSAVVEIDKAGHQLFLSLDDVFNHQAWLIGMKDRYLSMRKTLKPITQDYRRDGRWIRPQRELAAICGDEEDTA